VTSLGITLRNRSYHIDLIRQVCTNEFYAIHLPQWSPTDDSQSMYDYWFEYWDSLPDSPSIQQPVFYAICDFMDMLADSIGEDNQNE
jgi:hypothetical protein